MTRRTSHVDAGALFGMAADGSIWIDQPLELREEPAARPSLDSLEDIEAGHRPTVPDPEAGRGDVIKACEWCHADCYWDHFRGRLSHD